METEQSLREIKGKVCYLGGPGTGKTSHMIERFLFALSQGIKPLWILPTNGFAEHIKDLVLTGPQDHALVESAITTFDAWAKTTLAPKETIVTGIDLVPFVEKILLQIRPAGFSNVLELPGFAKSLCTAVVELLNANITKEQVSHFSDNNDRLAALADVLDELQKVMEHHHLVLEGQLVFRLSDFIRSGKIKRPSFLLFDGFYDFTPGQRSCFHVLEKGIDAIRFTLPNLATRMEFSKQNSGTRIQDILEKTGFEIIPFEAKDQTIPSGLSALTEWLFLKEKPLSKPDGVSFLSADTSRQVIETIANQIVRAKKEGTIKQWQDVGIVCRALRPYVPTIERIFDRYGIPVSIHGGLAPGDTAQGPMLLALLQEIGKPLPDTHLERVQSLERFLYLSFCLCSPSVRRQIKFNLDFILLEDGRIVRRKSPPESLEKLIEETQDEKVLNHLAFCREITQEQNSKKLSVAEFAKIVRKILQRYAQIVFLEQNIETKPGQPASSVIRAFAKTAERLEKSATLLGNEHLSWQVHFDAFRDHLQSQTITRMTRYLDAVHVVDVFEARSWLWSDVYLIGMNNHEFPERFRENLFCRDREREKLDVNLPTTKSANRMEALLFGFAATRARRRLTLARHRFDAGGNELAPSLFLDEVRSLYTTPPQKISAPLSLAAPIFPSEEWTTRHQVKPMVAFSLGRLEHFDEREKTENRIGRLLYEKRQNNIDLPAVLNTWIYPSAQDTLPEALQIALKERAEPFSVSAISAFVACPFRYFAGRLLNLRPRPMPLSLDPALLGSIAHDTLRSYFLKWQRDKQEPPLHKIFHAICKEQLKQIDETFDGQQELRRLENALVLLTEAERELWLILLSATPEKFEWSFGTRETPLMLSHGDRTEPFVGRIDRIDRVGAGLLIIDYKLSSGQIKPGDIEPITQGLLPQLPLYCAAVSQLANHPIAGMQIERIKHVDRSGLVNSGVLDDRTLAAFKEFGGIELAGDEFQSLIDTALNHIFDFCTEIRNGKIAISPRDKAATCNYSRCDFYDICRVDL